MIFARSAADTSIDAVEQAAVANRERPFPQLPKSRRPVDREKDELGAPDQILRRHVADGRKHTAILRVVAVISHHEVITGRYLINLRIVQRPIVSHLDNQMLQSIRQVFDLLSEWYDCPVAFII